MLRKLLLILMLSVSSCYGVSFSHIQSKSGHQFISSLTYTSSTTHGSLLIAVRGSFNDVNIGTNVSDTLGNTWYRVTNTGARDSGQCVWVAFNASSGGDTVSWAVGGGGDTVFAIMEYAVPASYAMTVGRFIYYGSTNSASESGYQSSDGLLVVIYEDGCCQQTITGLNTTVRVSQFSGGGDELYIADVTGAISASVAYGFNWSTTTRPTFSTFFMTVQGSGSSHSQSSKGIVQ